MNIKNIVGIAILALGGVAPAQAEKAESITVFAVSLQQGSRLPCVLAVSPNGQLIATGGGIPNGIVECWDFTGTRKWVFEGFAEKGAVTLLAFANNDVLAAGSLDGTLRFLNVADGAELYCLGEAVRNALSLKSDQPRPEGLAVAPNGNWGAFVTSDGVLKELDLRGLATSVTALDSCHVRTLWVRGEGCRLKTAITPDGQHVILNWGRSTSVLRAKELVDVSLTFHHAMPAYAMAVRPILGPVQLLLADADGKVELWHFKTGGADPVYSKKQITSLWAARERTRPKGKVMVRNVEKWETPRNAGELIREFKGQGLDQAHRPGEWIQQVAFSPDGQLAVSAGGSLKIWHVDTGQEIAEFTGEDYGFWRCCFTPDGRQVVSAGSDHKVRIWAVTGPE